MNKSLQWQMDPSGLTMQRRCTDIHSSLQDFKQSPVLMGLWLLLLIHRTTMIGKYSAHHTTRPKCSKSIRKLQKNKTGPQSRVNINKGKKPPL